MTKKRSTTPAHGVPAGIWVVVPAYGEEKYICNVLKKIKKYTNQIIVVDDGSSDNTVSLAREQGVVVLRHRVNLGKGAALRTGCDFAFMQLKATAVVLIDADDQHDPHEIPDLVAALTVAPVVLGIRDLDKGMPMIRRIVNRAASTAIEVLYGRFIPDIPSGYKAFTARAYRFLKWRSNDYAVEMEIAARLAQTSIRFTTVCIKTIYHDMNKGMTFLDTLSIFRNIINWRGQT